jgi:hypothetical protein
MPQCVTTSKQAWVSFSTWNISMRKVDKAWGREKGKDVSMGGKFMPLLKQNSKERRNFQKIKKDTWVFRGKRGDVRDCGGCGSHTPKWHTIGGGRMEAPRFSLMR